MSADRVPMRQRQFLTRIRSAPGWVPSPTAEALVRRGYAEPEAPSIVNRLRITESGEMYLRSLGL